MPSLVLNLVGPQSWGISSYFNQRDTAAEPTQSGVYGLIEAAMGLDRSETYPELNALRFGVRVDRPGQLAVDFQTAKDVAMAKGRGHKNEVIHKYYLADAHFMVVLEGELSILEIIERILLAPQRPVYLGRRAFSPIAPIILPDSFRSERLEAVMATYPWCASHLFAWEFRPAESPLRVVIDDPHGYETRNDRRTGPPAVHEFTQRPVRTFLVDPVLAQPIVTAMVVPAPIQPEPPTLAAPSPSTSHSTRKNELTAASAPTQLFESQLIFANPLFDPLNMQVLHKLLLNALQIGQSQTKVPVLFRLDAIANEQFRLVVRSPRRPDWSRLHIFDLIEYRIESFQPPAIAAGDQFKFSVRANPTKKRDGKKFGLTEPMQQLAWLHRKAQDRGGFTVVTITQHIQEEPRQVKRDVFFTSATFEGIGQVTDSDLFKDCLWRGLAASGGFAGFNMIQLIDDAA